MPSAERRPRTKAVVWTVVGYLALVGFLSLIQLSPDPLLIGLVVVALGALVLYVEDHHLGEYVPWPTTVVTVAGLGRGSDHLTTSLARRLSFAPTAPPESRRQLVLELHTRLVLALVARSVRLRGGDPRVDARILASLPADLAALLTEPPDERLLDLDHLNSLLERIELLR